MSLLHIIPILLLIRSCFGIPTSASLIASPTQALSVEEPSFSAHNQPFENTTGVTSGDRCEWYIPGTSLYIVAQYNPYYPIPARRMDQYRFSEFIRFVDTFLSVEAASAGGPQERVRRGWRKDYRWERFVLQAVENTRPGLINRRSRYSELQFMLSGIHYCEEKIGYRQIWFFLYRYLIARRPMAQEAITRGYLFASVDSDINAVD
ncbi:MAG: hypothetical protein Q9214_004266 [Letrouitia sp. 1 TL-2023]